MQTSFAAEHEEMNELLSSVTH